MTGLSELIGLNRTSLVASSVRFLVLQIKTNKNNKNVVTVRYSSSRTTLRHRPLHPWWSVFVFFFLFQTWWRITATNVLLILYISKEGGRQPQQRHSDEENPAPSSWYFCTHVNRRGQRGLNEQSYDSNLRPSVKSGHFSLIVHLWAFTLIIFRFRSTIKFLVGH